jgi:spermidine synthase
MSSGAYLYGVRQIGMPASKMNFGNWVNEQTLLSYEEGSESVVSVRRLSDTFSLQVNGKTDASSGDQFTQRFLAELPLAMHPAPKKALLIGWGSGCTAGSALLYPLESADCVEIEKATLNAAPFFRPMNRQALSDPRMHLHVQDGRNFLLSSSEHYDVILSEPSNPWIKGVASLFTLEYYRQVAAHLAENGLFCQWFHYYNMGSEDLKNQFRTLATAFPYASLWIVPPPLNQTHLVVGDILLLGSNSPQHINMERLKRVFSEPAIASDFREFDVLDPYSMALCYVADRQGILDAAGEGPMNTDDHPSLEFSAPQYLYLSSKELDALSIKNFYSFESHASLLPPVENDPDFAGLGGSLHQAAFLAKIGDLSSRRDMATRAIGLLRKSLDLNPRESVAWMGMGFLATQDTRFGDAVDFFEKAIAVDPGFVEAYVDLGKFYLSKGNMAAAGPVFDRLIQRKPKSAEGWLGKGFVVYESGDKAKAKEYFERCLKLDPNEKMAARVLERMKREEASPQN